MGSLASYFDADALNPHGVCLLWRPGLIWLHVVSDLLIGIAYFSIPLALVYLVLRRRDIAFGWMFMLFAIFIVACGTTHFFSVWTLWHADYLSEGMVKAFTAIVSVATALMLWPMLPMAIALPSPSALRKVNAELTQRIGERDSALLTLRASEERFRTLFSEAPAPLSSVDGSGRLTAVSTYWLDLLGYERNDVIGRKLGDFIEGGPGFLLDDIQHQPALKNIELQFRRRDGALVDVLLSARSGLGNGSHGETMIVLVDVTERRRLEESLRQAQKMEAVGQLTGGVAHDFNNLLTVVLGNLDMAKRQLPDDDTPLSNRLRRAISSAIKGALRGASLTERLLAFSRRQALSPIPLNLNDVVANAAELVRPSLGEGIEIRTDLSSDLWSVSADQNQLESTLINLAINARDAMPSGGEIAIRTDNWTLHHDEFHAESELLPGEYVRLSLSDTGTGMPPETLARAFDPFFTTKDIGKGSGLGLSQVYGFLKQSGGHVELTSGIDRGTVATLYFPRHVAAPKPLNEQAGNAAALEAAGAGTVLIVEDDDEVRRTAKSMFDSLGYHTIDVGTPTAAVTEIERGTPIDLLFVDIGLPERDGRDLARQIAGLRPGIRILFTTGHATAETSPLEASQQLLLKPFSLNDLAGRLAIIAKS